MEKNEAKDLDDVLLVLTIDLKIEGIYDIDNRKLAERLNKSVGEIDILLETLLEDDWIKSRDGIDHYYVWAKSKATHFRNEQNGYSGKFKTAQKDKTRANWAPQPGVIINSVVSAIIGGLAVYFMTGC